MNKRGQETRRHIKKSACSLFAEKGFKDVTMKDICEAAKLSRGGLYCHYESTRQIFQEMIEDMTDRQEDMIDSKIKQNQSAVTILDELLDVYEHEMMDSQASLSVAIYEYFSIPDISCQKNALYEQYLISANTWKKLMQYGIDRQEFYEVDIDAIFDLIVFSYQGVRMYSKLMPIDKEIPLRIIKEIRKILVRNDGSGNNKDAFLNPCDVTEKVPGFPEVCITTFSEGVIREFVKNNKAEIIANLYSANGTIPVYEIQYADKKMGLFLSRVGAPACAAGLEEIIALGAKKVVQFGCCGILNQPVADGKIIIPSSAVRDEGTSYHYFPGSEEISADRSLNERLVQYLEKHKVPYVVGKVWTTDAIYRETPEAIKKRKKQGCIAVEMECSASLAVAKFRNIPMIQFFYGADNLDADQWEIRDLTDYGLSLSDKYMTIALECGLVF